MADRGTTLFIADLKFLEKRQNINDSIEMMEAKLLKNYAIILIQILCYDNFEHLEENLAGEDIEFTSLIESLMNSKKELKNYINGKTRFRMTFEKLLKHHIFKSEKLLNSDIIDFADEFDLYYSNRDNIQTN